MQQNRLIENGAGIIPYAIALITLIIFSPVIWHDFVNYDDPAFVTENLHILGGLNFENYYWAFTTGYQGNWIPLTWLSHMADVQLFGLQAAGHHAINLLLHTANAVLLYFFFKKTTAAPWKSAAVALLFALHPLHIESVAWISERKDLLSTFFLMLTLHTYRQYALTESRMHYIAALLLFACGLLSKSMLVSAPFLLLCLDYWPLARQQHKSMPVLLREKIPFALLAIGSGLATYIAQDRQDAINHLYTLTYRASGAVMAYLTYIGKMFWPAKLSVIYPHSLYPPSSITVAAALLFLLAITAAAYYLRKISPYFLLGWLWYGIALFPVCGLVKFGAHALADRYTYIPFIGLFCLIAWGLPDVAHRLKLSAQALPVASIVVFTVMTILTARQVSHWKNTETLFRHAVDVTVNNWIAHTNLGIVLEQTGREAEAIDHYLAAVTAKPTYAPALIHLGYLYAKQGELQLAIDAHIAGIRYEPDNNGARYNLGILYLQAGSVEGALAQHQKLLTLHPETAAKLMLEITSMQNQGETPKSDRLKE